MEENFGLETQAVALKEREPLELFRGEPSPKLVKKVLKMPRYVNLNQPQIVSPSSQMGESRSSNYMAAYSISHASRADYLSDEGDEDGRVLSAMFTTTFRRLKNRNKFAQQVFFILGVQTCFCFIVAFLLVYQPHIAEQFKENIFVLLSIFTTFIVAIIASILFCALWLREPPHHIIGLVIITVSVALQFAAVAAYFRACDMLMYVVGSLMMVFFIGSLLASQGKWEVVGAAMLLVFIAMALVISVVVITLLTLIVIGKPRWEYIGASVVTVLATTIFLLYMVRAMLKEQELKVTDFIYGALILFMSITTIYIVFAIIRCCRGLRNDRNQEPPLDSIPPRR